jgi:hypothetical protein
MISLTAIIVLFAIGWSVRWLWKATIAAMSTSVASSQRAEEPAR